MNVAETLLKLWNDSGFAKMFAAFGESGWQNLVMLAIGCVLLYLAIVKKFEPLLLCGIAFGCILSNLPGAGLYNQELWDNFMNADHAAYHSYGTILKEGGLLDFFYIGVKTSIYPCLIFLGVGAMTDFGPLLSRVCSWAQLLRWACSLHFWALLLWALPVNRPLPLVSLVARTALPLFSSPPGWLPSCWAPSLWQLTPIWR